MSKAVLKAKMRQKEDAWVSERERLCAGIAKNQQENVDSDKRYRELEMRFEALEEQNKRLTLQVMVATSWGGTNDSMSEFLRRELKNKDDEIELLRITKLSLECEVYATQSENETLARNYDELERENLELESYKWQNTKAEIKLQFVTTEYTAMRAQLNATCADLEEIKVYAKADLQARRKLGKNERRGYCPR